MLEKSEVLRHALVLMVMMLGGAAQGGDYIVELSQNDVDLATAGVGPGDTVYLRAGTRGSLRLWNINGSTEQPVLVTNLGGQVVFQGTGSHTVRFSYCSNFLFRGTPGAGYDYGIYIASAAAGMSGLSMQDRTSDFEVCDIEIANTGFAGILAKDDGEQRPNFVMANVFIHDTYIHDTEGEGMYVGSSFWTRDHAHELHNVHIYDNYILRAGWDGIQVGCANVDSSIHDNIIIDAGMANELYQRHGIMLNAGSVTDIYNNLIVDPRGCGMYLKGRGGNHVYNNVIVRPLELGIGVHDDDDFLVGTGYYIMNNTIIEPAGDGLYFRSQSSSGNIFYNNIVTDPGGDYTWYYSSASAAESSNVYAASTAAVGFINPAEDDYRLRLGSPAVDSGLDLSAYGLSYDLENTPRPIGDAWDIGAYEAPLDAPETLHLAYERTNLGGGLSGWTFYIANDDSFTAHYTVQLGFQGVDGATIQQIAYNGAMPIHTEVMANIADGGGSPPYSKALDTWVFSPFGDNTYPGTNPLTGSALTGFYEAANAFALSCYSGPGSAMGDNASVLYVVANGDVGWVGTITREGLDHAVSGRTEQTATPLPGDYNGDGTVSGADYVVWADTFGNDGSPDKEDLRADGNGDGLVSGTDYVIWADNFGASGG